ncbi:LexA family protein [Anaerococcus hydrogenalis]|uniref:DNA-binding helix-turn-helix protein n=1 Tax=Anaerococcus hydrogenalis ACS-025-V-Sch4 TaxID=879306 RepID=F0H2G3_9FIRM|nr:XRE family transcriptional regulator [Anaerococcus hydrogenalis]EGC83412.1 DNA-binding helix-turn-helix protein [Anaerococcus hydrogenalis ACS-025-V-Sch4]
MSVGVRLKQLRKSSGKTQRDLAKLLYVTASSIGMYERDERTPSPDVLKKYADIFDVSLDYILGHSRNLKKGEDYATINVYGSIPAGIPIEAIEDISDTEDISFKDFDKNKTYIGLKVEGDSMYPKYLQGDTIILELTPDCESGTDAAVYVNGYEATLKTVIKNDNGTITLMPINTSYPPKTYGKDDDPIKILGIVKEIRRKI